MKTNQFNGINSQDVNARPNRGKTLEEQALETQQQIDDAIIAKHEDEKKQELQERERQERRGKAR